MGERVESNVSVTTNDDNLTDAQITERGELVKGLRWAVAWIEAVDQVPDREAEPREHAGWVQARGVLASDG